MIISRKMQSVLLKSAQQYPVVAVLGPRQSGKTTLTQQTFPDYDYVSMSDLDSRIQAQQDPRKFFARYESSKGLIVDEMQEVPELFSYMQGVVDRSKKLGFFIITGSSNFLLMKNITQSLAGRIAILELWPLSMQELDAAKLKKYKLEEILWRGMYPRLYVHDVDPSTWYANYITTYVERDVRQLLQVGDIVSFQKFLKLCAARVGNLLNYADLARDCDISPNTAKAWISILQTSFIITLLHPYYKNFSKRVVKTPKLYFNDVGLACRLLDIEDFNELFVHSMRGALFENFVINEFCKSECNLGKKPQLYFWRDVQGHEIDCIIEKSQTILIPVEVKSGMTVQPKFYKELIDWNEITGQSTLGYIVYAGDQTFEGSHAQIVAWNNIDKIQK